MRISARICGRYAGRRLSLTGVLVVALAVLGLGACPTLAAVPGPVWSLESIAQPTSFSIADNGGCAEGVSGAEEGFRDPRCDRYTLVLTNVGVRASSGQITVKDTLPEGITVPFLPGGETERTGFKWRCSTEMPASREVVTCTAEHAVSALTAAATITIPINVNVGSGVLVNEVTVEGGGAEHTASVESETPVGSPPSAFGVFDFTASALDAAGEIDTQAGGHPAALTSSFLFPSATSASQFGVKPYPVEFIKQIVTDLPAGVVGDALATPTCPLTNLTDITPSTEPDCPSSTRVGKLVLITAESNFTELTVWNVTPEHGYPAELGVFLPNLQRAALLYASVVGSGADTHVRVVSTPQTMAFLPIVGVSLTLFGVPAVIDESPLTPVALFTNPSDCSASGFTSKIYADSWRHPGRFGSDGQPDLSDPNWKSASTTSPPVAGCEALQFHPSLSFAPEPAHSGADEPSGYESTLTVPQNEDPNGLASPPLKNTVVTLPAGVAISPSAADGLVGCQVSGSEGIELDSSQPGHCPAASKVGEVKAVTPVLKEPLEGGVYVAQPGCSPCSEAQAEKGEVFALYLELGSENSGVHVKVPGTVEVGGEGREGGKHNDLAPGQVRTTFADTPQQPVSELKLSFNSGPRAPLANPQTCGGFASSAVLEPWSHTPAPGEAQGTPNALLNPSFVVSSCTGRFSPGFSAGTVNPQAGGYSPFSLTFSRADREQDLSGVTVNMPPGLIGKIAGIAQCPDAQAGAGSCPAASRVGTVTAAAGSGSHPFWQSGAVYLTGPYRGAPFGLSVVVPAVAGPFNLGNIAVRAAIYINPATAQVSVVSDPLPQNVDGVPLRVKTVNVTVDREAFISNPTNCAEQTIGARIASAQGASAAVASRFQAANCANLPFKPSFTASTQGRTSKANGASLTVKVSEKPGEANIHKVDLTLPLALPARLTTLQKACTEAQFNANPAGCPEASVIGMATARTPVLNVPLVGPAYLVSHGGAAFPDVEFILQGEGVEIVLDGGTDIKKGITYSRFETVPDAPISSFETVLPEGSHSVLATNIPASAKGSLCGRSLVIPTSITGQNGAVVSQSTKVAVTGCAKVKAKALTRAQKLAKALKACRKDRRGKKRAACEKTAHKRYGAQGKRKAKAKRR
jgi:hypothetical protein